MEHPERIWNMLIIKHFYKGFDIFNDIVEKIFKFFSTIQPGCAQPTGARGVGLNYRPFTLYFFPYYFLAVTGIAVHIATIHYQKTGSRRGSAVIAVFGIVTAFLILVGFTNGFRFRDVPVPYQELVLHFHAHP